MNEDEKIIEKDGRQYATLPDGSQVLIENEIVNDSNWINVHQAEKLLDRGDRQIRNLATKNSWNKKYAYINKKPIRHYYKPELEKYLSSRVTEAVIVPADYPKENNQTEEIKNALTSGQSLISKSTVEELDTVLKKVEPYLEDFLKTYKLNQERIIALEDKKGTAEKSAVFWKTSSVWLIAVALLALLAWYKVDQHNSSLSISNTDLSGKFESTQKELYEAKLLLNQKDHEMELLKIEQKETDPSKNPTAPTKE